MSTDFNRINKIKTETNAAWDSAEYNAKRARALEAAAKAANHFLTNALVYRVLNDTDAKKALAVQKMLEESIYYT